MQIVVNHLTRMKTKSRVCVAGIDLQILEHIRPVTPASDLLTRELLRENGGPVGVGAILDLGDVRATPNAPENEDHECRTENLHAGEDLEDDVYLALLDQVSDTDMESIFGDALYEVRREKFAVDRGNGERSLGVIELSAGELRLDGGNLYLALDEPHTPAVLRVSDVRFYEADHETVKRRIVKDVNRRLSEGQPCHVMMGLARHMPDAQAGEVHWLMANGLCLADRAVSDVP